MPSFTASTFKLFIQKLPSPLKHRQICECQAVFRAWKFNSTPRNMTF